MQFNLFVFLTIFSFINSVKAASETNPYQICGNSSPDNKILSHWKKTSNGYCAEVSCKIADYQIKRTKCFNHLEEKYPNTIWETYSDDVKAPNMAGYEGFAYDRRLYPGEDCFDECRPVKNSVLGIALKAKSGLELATCRQCFFKLDNMDRELRYTIPEMNLTLYSGMKCHHLCRLPKGDFSYVRDFSPECKSCVGMGGLPAEKFDYLLTQSGECWEVENKLKKRPVPIHLCQKKEELILTHYQSDSSRTIKSIIFNLDPKCREIDNVSSGKIFNQNVASILCNKERIEDTDRSIQNKDGSPPARSPKSHKGVIQH